MLAVLAAFALVELACSNSASISTPANRYALVIGVQDYPDATYTYKGQSCTTSSDLDYPDDDAADMADLLSKEGWTVTQRLISSSDSAIATTGSPTYANIESDIASLSADSSATILVYYSGHGSVSSDGSTVYMIPYDGLLTTATVSGGYVYHDSDESKWISPATMTNWLAAVPAKHRILILDSCYSGGFTLSDGAVDTSPADYGTYEDGTSETGLLSAALSKFGTLISSNISSYGDTEVLTLAAAGSDEYSYDDSEHKHGAFTYYLLKAADSADTDGDGYVSMTEAYIFTKSKIQSVWDAEYSSDKVAQEYYNYYGYVPDFLPHISGGTGDLVLYAGE